MFNSGYKSSFDDAQPVKKAEPRFSPKIVAAIHAKPIPEYTRDRVFDDERPQPSAGKSKPQKKSKPAKAMQTQIEEMPVMEAGTAPEGIQSTKDYSQFKLLPTNRPIDRSHVNRLAAAIRKRNLLHLNPIVVNGNSEIIEGQHRLEAAKLLGISIFFVQDDAVTQDDIAGMNSNKKNWALKDYIHFYAEQGKEDYIAFSNFCKKNPALPPATLLSLVAKDGSAKKGGYKDGNIDIAGMGMAWEIVRYLADFADHTKLVYSGKFVDAVAFMVRTGLYDHAHMIKKLEQNPGMLQPAAQVKGWIENLERIYNRHVRDENLVIFLKRR